MRTATAGDAVALHRLSGAFVRTGALRERPLEQYARDAGDFLVAESAAGGIVGCVALECHLGPEEPGAGRPAVVYNFCVAPASQGLGVGSALLTAALATAVAYSVTTVFTATAGGGALFLRHGFTPGDGRGAPAAWLAALDPRRGSRVLSRSPARRE
ncbi:GNAT family N-acetyltransferase [Streptomyces sp. NPDC018031]|uniref:GNAT family N-acetyltransferase n=1 Tax=Streptomyces sp. NPDC018031 TaxID=3365033 RepID=UPI003797E7F2